MVMFPGESLSTSKYDLIQATSLVGVPPVHEQILQCCECAEPDWKVPETSIIVSHFTLQAERRVQAATYLQHMQCNYALPDRHVRWSKLNFLHRTTSLSGTAAARHVGHSGSREKPSRNNSHLPRDLKACQVNEMADGAAQHFRGAHFVRPVLILRHVH